MSSTVEGFDDWFSIIETAQRASESITPIVHEAIISEFKRRRNDIPRSSKEPSGALIKSLTNPSDRLHFFNVDYHSGRLRIEVGSRYRGARFQIRRIPKPVAQRVHNAVFESYREAVRRGHLPQGMSIKSVRNRKYRSGRGSFDRRSYTRLTRRTRT